MTPLKQQIIKELHAFNQLDNKIVEAFGAKEYCAKNGITYNIIEDNPVPSLEEIYKKYRDSDICEGFDSPEILHFMYFIKHGNMHGKTLKDFQNGVETNNEQPKSGHMTEISWGSELDPDETPNHIKPCECEGTQHLCYGECRDAGTCVFGEE